MSFFAGPHGAVQLPRADDDEIEEVSLDLRRTTVRIEDEDGDLVAILHDGETRVTFEPGVGGTPGAAIRNAERIAATLLAYAEKLRSRVLADADQLDWYTPPEVTTPQQPPMNAAGF